MGTVLYGVSQIVSSEKMGDQISQKENQGQSSIVGNLSLYSPKALKIAKLELLEKLILVVHWHSLSSPNPHFSKTAFQLWGPPTNQVLGP